MRLAAALASVALVFAAAHAEESPFRANRGTAPPPPAAFGAGSATAPPEGEGAAGIRFGAWRKGTAAENGPAFLHSVRAVSPAELRAALESNGFQCASDGERGEGRAPHLECRLAIVEKSCEIEWWAVVERPGAEPLAGQDVICSRAG